MSQVMALNEAGWVAETPVRRAPAQQHCWRGIALAIISLADWDTSSGKAEDMASRTPVAANTQIDIWSRILEPDRGDLNPEAVAFILRMDFTPSDRERLQELNERANEGALTKAERTELEEFIRVGDLLATMQSKARRSLKRHGQAS